MTKFSQEPCTKQHFPSLKTLQKPLTQGHLEPSGPTCISFYWKEQKNNGFVEVFLHFSRQMHLSPGTGHLCLEAIQTLAQRDPVGQAQPGDSVEGSILCGHVCAPGCGVMYVPQWLQCEDYRFSMRGWVSDRISNKEMRKQKGRALEPPLVSCVALRKLLVS